MKLGHLGWLAAAGGALVGWIGWSSTWLNTDQMVALMVVGALLFAGGIALVAWGIVRREARR